MMIVIMAAALVLRPLKSWDKVYVRTFNLMVFAALCQAFSVYDNNFSRLADYYYQFSALFVPFIMEPGYRQAEMWPEHASEIRCWDKRVYFAAAIIITIFALWYYSNYIESSAAILNNYKFFWQIDPYSLYGQ